MQPLRASLVLSALVLAASVRNAAATILDTIKLQTPSPLSFTDGTGALYSLTATQSAGSGQYDPFMRIQRTGNEQGYNSSKDSGSHATMDLVSLPGNDSSQLRMSDILSSDDKITLGLDYNESGSSGKSTITLQELVLVISTDADKTGPVHPGSHTTWTPQSMPMSAGDQVIYQMTSAMDTTGHPFQIQLDANKRPGHGNGGSGQEDMTVSFDLSALPSLAALGDSNHYLYVYSRFSGSDGGYEEWRTFKPSTSDCGPPNGGGNIPEPASLSILGLGAIGLLTRRRTA